MLNEIPKKRLVLGQYSSWKSGGKEDNPHDQKEPTLILIPRAGWVKELFGERRQGLLFSRNLSPSDGRDSLPNRKINVVGDELYMPVPEQHINSAWVPAAGADVGFKRL